MRILVVEDEAQLADAIGAILRSHDFSGQSDGKYDKTASPIEADRQRVKETLSTLLKFKAAKSISLRTCRGRFAPCTVRLAKDRGFTDFPPALPVEQAAFPLPA